MRFMTPRKTSIILHNIRSAHNVGAVFRTADGAGASKIFLSGYTPRPTDRFGRENAEIKKTSLGAVDTIPYEIVDDVTALCVKLKAEGVKIVAVEQTPHAIPYKSFVPTEDVAFVFGNEITGVEQDVLDLCDTHIHIPMHGTKESLNVSTCVGIILFHFR
jgi:23S rRNA (guanosine2251-2'-O)-methyltransferase